MKKLLITCGVVFCFFGITMGAKFCSPARIPLQELMEGYNFQKGYLNF